MFTEEELYWICRMILLCSPLTQKGGDGYYFFSSTDEGPYKVTTYFNYEHQLEVGVSGHRALLEDGRAILYIQTETEPPRHVTLAYPGDIRENGFLWENLVKVLGEELDPNSLRMFGSNGHVSADEPWIQKIFIDLCKHIPWLE